MGRSLKSQLEDAKKEIETKQAEKDLIETQLKTIQESPPSASEAQTSSSPIHDPTETETLLKESLENIHKLESEVETLKKEVQTLTENNTNLSAHKERMKPMLQKAQGKIKELNELNKTFESAAKNSGVAVEQVRLS